MVTPVPVPAESPLQLEDNEGTVERIYNTQGYIPGNYKKAVMIQGATPTMWLVYSVNQWGQLNDGESTAVGTAGVVSTSYPIRSAQAFNVVNPGIVIFEHSRYRGNGELLRGSIPSIIDLPQGKTGISSIYITGGVWNLFKGFNYTGALLSYNGKTDLGPGFYTFEGLALNKQLKSIRFVGASS